MKIRGLTLEELTYFCNFLKQLSENMVRAIPKNDYAPKTVKLPPTVKKLNKLIDLFDVSKSYLVLKKEDVESTNALISTSLEAIRTSGQQTEHVDKVTVILSSILNKINPKESK